MRHDMGNNKRQTTCNGHLDLHVQSEAEVINLAPQVRAFLGENCSREEHAEVVTVVVELAANSLRYAGSGRLSLVIDGDLLTATCEDNGPGILEWDTRKYDTVQLNHSLGFGLGIVSRLMDTMDIHTQAGEGTRVVATRRLGVRTGPPPTFDLLTLPSGAYER